MASSHPVTSNGLADQPFVDYFWIAGLDGQDLLDTYRAQTSLLDHIHLAENSRDVRKSLPVYVDTLAEENEDASSVIHSPTAAKADGQDDLYQRLSKLSDEARRSIRSIDGLTNRYSNRSSGTIRLAPVSGQASPAYRYSSALTDADFDNAIKKFNTDRDAFYLDLNFKEGIGRSSGSSKPKTRTQKILAEDPDLAPSRSVVGSVRRHISFKEMNSMKRQPSVVRQASKRASRRLSSYNAVIPTPDNIQSSPNEHPLKRHFEPVLLDRYPRPSMTDEIKRRNAFPDYIPMFAFPNDIQIISSDVRPPSTWHEFSMTATDNSKTPAVCVIIWIPMNRQTANELEQLCEEWRKANMTDAERELASSLGERLAVERAKLSRLLAKLPNAPQGSNERDVLEDDIGTVEEKINLMSDMLRPLRHGAANRIEGLTDGDTGLWVPRAYGLIGKDEFLVPIWKQWLKAVVVPMLDGTVLRVPPTSPKVGIWQPLERFVRNLTCEATRPSSSKVQIEVSVRELRLHAKKEAVNELPGSRSTDLYPLFRALTIQSIVLLFEYVMAEARIILVSSHIAMLKSVSKALLDLLWPMDWAGVYIPVLPARLMQVLEAPCPYICGVVRTEEEIKLPDDDFIMVDLDKDELRGTEHPPSLPKQLRRKLVSLLHLAAPHHNTRGVPTGPPAYTAHAFPNSMFVGDHGPVFTAAAPSTNLVALAGLSSTAFGPQAARDEIRRCPLLNAFIYAGPKSRGSERPMTAYTEHYPSPDGSDQDSPQAPNFGPFPRAPVSRNDSGFALQSSLRDKRAGQGEAWSKPSDTFSVMRRKASLPFVRHGSSPSVVSLNPLSSSVSTYAPSSYAQSTLAASTIMPGVAYQQVRNTETRIWTEGHCLNYSAGETHAACTVCDERLDSGYYRCTDCLLVTHGQCARQVTLVCQGAFYPDQIRVAFARFFASLFYPYRKFISPIDPAQRKSGMSCKLNVDAWIRSLPSDHGQYLELLKQTQAFNEWIAARELASAASSDSVMLFDALIMAKRGRSGRMRSSMNMFGFGGRQPFGHSRGSFGSGTSLDFLADTTSHLWRLSSVPMSKTRPDLGAAAKGRDYVTIVKRAPAKLEDDLFDATDISEIRNGNTGSHDSDSTTLRKDKLRYLQRINPLSMNAP